MGTLRTALFLVTATSVVLAGPGTALAAGTPRFAVPQVTPAGVVLTDLEVADVTTDGRPDALVADPATPGLGLLRGTGQGRLGPRVSSALPGNAAATAVAVADFTNDGLPDAAVATVSASGNGLAVLRGRGDGTFVLSATIPVPAIDVIAADFNDDGKQDVAAIADRPTGDSLNVALGNGAGGFAAPTSYPPPFALSYNDLNTADVDADGDLDLVYGAGCPAVRLNAGNGTFGPQICNGDPQARWGYALALGDLNGDGLPDLASAGDGFVTVGLGTGDGRFTITARYTGLAANLGWLDVEDVTADGKLDVVAGSDDLALVLRGRGDGTLGPVDRWVAGGANITAVDLSGDGRRDLVSAGGLRSGDIAATLGTGPGTFRAARNFVTFGPAAVGTIVRSGDLNGDARPDVVIAVSGTPVAHLNQGNGRFGAPLTSGGFSVIQSMTLGDVNRDGRLDVIAGAYQPGDPENVFVMLGRGNGRFDPAQPMSNGSGAAVLGIAVGDVNADGNPDIVSNTFTSLSVLPGNGDGTFAAPVLSGAGAGDQRATLLGDLTGDGRLDAVSAVVTGTNDNARTTLYVNAGNGDGTFTFVSSRTADTNVRAAALADLTGDGQLDVALVGIKGTHTGRTGLFRFVNSGGVLQAPSYQPAGWSDLALADFNADGLLDAVSVCAELAGGCLRINLGRAGAGFGPPLDLPTGHDPVSVTTADFSGDGRPDIVELLSARAPSTFAVVVNATP